MQKVPSYCRHKASGKAVVRIGGKDLYLGEYGSEESLARYERAINEWRAGVDQHDVCFVVELCAAYISHAESYYRKNGKNTSEYDDVKLTIRTLRHRHKRIELVAAELKESSEIPFL